MTCVKCGHRLSVGDFPFCRGNCNDHVGGKYSSVRDDIPGGVWLENYGPEPIKVYSHAERRRIMVERGLQEKDTFVALPGTDKSPIGTVRWDAGIDAYTMEAARVLVSRNGRHADSDHDTSKMVANRFNLAGSDADVLEALGEK